MKDRKVDSMKSIDIMMEEHQYIIRMLKVTRKLCYRILKHEPVEYKDFYKVIDFVRNYADKHHHSKEEQILFKEMKISLNEQNRLGPVTGMLVEHDQGRLYMQELEKAVQAVLDGDLEARLDIIANAISYTHLLYRHIDKEDQLIYPLGMKKLSKEILDRVELESTAIEDKATENNLQKKYIDLLVELESKVE